MTNKSKDKNGTVLQSTCVLCGGKLVQTGKRPPTYCSDNCREFSKFWNAAETRLSKIAFRDATKKKRMLGDMLAAINTTRGKKVLK